MEYNEQECIRIIITFTCYIVFIDIDYTSLNWTKMVLLAVEYYPSKDVTVSPA